MDPYVMWVDLLNLMSHLDEFAFVSAEGSIPESSPVRPVGEGVFLVGYNAQKGGYLAGILAGGLQFGGPDVYYAKMLGREWTLGCGGLSSSNIKLNDLSADLGLGFGGGTYGNAEETGGFLYGGAEALGEHIVFGFGMGVSDGPPQSYAIPSFGPGAITQ